MHKFLTIAAICIGLLMSGPSYANHDTKDITKETVEFLKLFQFIFEKIRRDFVDPVDDKEILEAGIRGMIGKLDKHSSYLDAEEYKRMNENMNDSFVGIGAIIEKDEASGFIRIIAPIEDSPAILAGIKAGDLVIKVNDILLKPLSLFDGMKAIRGPEDTNAVLNIKRDEEELTITVVRATITANVVRHRILPSNIGYLRLKHFSSNATERVSDAVEDIVNNLPEGKSLEGMILDFRGNPGGLLRSAIDISDMFITKGMIVSTRGRDGDNHHSSKSATDALKIPVSVPMVVLIDGGSASASEIVSGTLQDLARATVVGVKSFGKGSVQSIIPMPTGGALRLTMAKYYTASGKTIHGVGITPDIIVEMPEDYKQKSVNEIDPQLQKAIDIILSGEARTGQAKQ